MMKSSANRRRGKQEIIDAKLAEQQRLRDIEVKMLEHSHMQKQLAEAEEELEGLQEQQNERESFGDSIKILKEQGLLKRIPGSKEGQQRWKPVENWEEVEVQRLKFADEKAEEQRLKRENAVLARDAPHLDRRRAGNYLEAINDFNDNKLKSSLVDSVILVDHPADIDSQMEEQSNNTVAARIQLGVQ